MKKEPFIHHPKTNSIKILLAVISLMAILFSHPLPVSADDGSQDSGTTAASSSSEPYAGETLCLPGNLYPAVQDCLPLGPAGALIEYAEQGILYPPPPIPAYPTPISLATIPYSYIKVTYRGSIPIYASEQDAFDNNSKRTLPAGFNYFSYSVRSESEKGIYYKVKTGEWVWGGYVSRISPPSFQGFIFYETPKFAFGWVLDTAPSRQSPATDAALTGKEYKRFDIVYIYQTQTTDDGQWYLIGYNEWIEKKYVAKVEPYPVPPAGVDNNRWIELDLESQVLTVYDQGKLVFATLASSGLKPFYTKPGLFQIYEKKETETMSTGDPTDYYYLEDVPWTMYYDEARALHGAYWHSRFGSPISHGCVNLSIADAHWLFNWAKVGDYVYVWDPSGKTPTDPAYYTKGGP